MPADVWTTERPKFLEILSKRSPGFLTVVLFFAHGKMHLSLVAKIMWAFCF